jgi:hypothetical protein
MYPYFALRVAKIHVPRIFAKFITSCQFAQMVICLVANSYAAFHYSKKQEIVLVLVNNFPCPLYCNLFLFQFLGFLLALICDIRYNLFSLIMGILIFVQFQ